MAGVLHSPPRGKAERAASRIQQAVSNRECVARYRAGHLDQVRAQKRAYMAAHREEGKASVARWRKAHPDESRARSRAWHAAHPEVIQQLNRKWHEANPEQAREHHRRRRVRLAGLTGIRGDMTSPCAICSQPIDATLRYPDPMSLSMGHEPPLVRAADLGVFQVWERPEHRRCNLRKNKRLDSEIGL